MYMAAYMVPSVSQFWARRMRKAREYSGRGGKDEGAASCMSPGTLPALAPHRQSLPLDSCLLGEEPLEAELRLRVWHLAPPAHRQQFTEWPPHQLRALLPTRAVTLGHARRHARHIHRRRKHLLRQDARRHEETRPEQPHVLGLHGIARLLAHLLRRAMPQTRLALVLGLEQSRDDLLHPQVGRVVLERHVLASPEVRRGPQVHPREHLQSRRTAAVHHHRHRIQAWPVHHIPPVHLRGRAVRSPVLTPQPTQAEEALVALRRRREILDDLDIRDRGLIARSHACSLGESPTRGGCLPTPR